jgi:UrcA family protein
MASLGISGMLGLPGLLMAQEDDAILEEIIVQAPIEVERSVDRTASSSSAVQTEIVELKRKVNVEDLDLSKTSDVQQLEERIRLVAEDSCNRLAEMFPFDDSGTQSVQRCTKRAIAGAMERTENAIASLQE